MDNYLLSSVDVLFQKTYIEALLNNQKHESKWESYKGDLSGVHDNLKLFLKKLNVPVMVPVGNKALFRGKLVHTNDITISLGDGYFMKGSVDQALEVVSRRISKCDEMLLKLRKERSLLESRTNLHETNLFSSNDTKEIIENYEEGEEEKWRVEHRKKVKDYKQKLALMKETEPSGINNDEDLFKRLEILEMEEEINDELDRLGNESEESSSENTDVDTSDESLDEVCSSSDIKVDHPGYNKTPLSSIIKKPNLLTSKQSNVDMEYIRIEFKHSSNIPKIEEADCSDFINSPSDIYKKFGDFMNKKEKRRVSFADLPEVKTFTKDFSNFTEEPVQSAEELPVAFGDVVERTVPIEYKVTESRPVSKFKSSRSKQNTR